MKLTKFHGNPILVPNPANSWESLSVCNPGVWYEKGVFYLLYRAAGNAPSHKIFLGLATSRDGFNFERVSDKPVLSPSADGPDAGSIEDPRIVKFGDFFYITYAYRPFPPGQYWLHHQGLAYMPDGPPEAPRLIKENLTNTGILMSKDLKTFHRMGRLTEPNSDNRDVMFFPEKVNGKYILLHRKKELHGPPCPSIWISFMDNLMDYNDGVLLVKNEYWWETKIGGGCPPLKTDAGWLFIYHGVCPKGVYRAGVILLDLEDPRKVIARSSEPILEPEYDYEINGLWSSCVFPCGSVIVDDTLFVYYGAADKHIGAATCKVRELIEHLNN